MMLLLMMKKMMMMMMMMMMMTVIMMMMMMSDNDDDDDNIFIFSTKAIIISSYYYYNNFKHMDNLSSMSQSTFYLYLKTWLTLQDYVTIQKMQFQELAHHALCGTSNIPIHSIR